MGDTEIISMAKINAIKFVRKNYCDFDCPYLNSNSEGEWCTLFNYIVPHYAFQNPIRCEACKRVK